MSTRSEMYHCFGLGVVEVTRVDYGGGRTVYHARHRHDRVVCPECHGRDVICQGTVEREFRLPPIGRREVRVRFTVQRVECPACGGVRQEALPFAKPYRRYLSAQNPVVY